MKNASKFVIFAVILHWFSTYEVIMTWLQNRDKDKTSPRIFRIKFPPRFCHSGKDINWRCPLILDFKSYTELLYETYNTEPWHKTELSTYTKSILKVWSKECLMIKSPDISHHSLGLDFPDTLVSHKQNPTDYISIEIRAQI